MKAIRRVTPYRVLGASTLLRVLVELLEETAAPFVISLNLQLQSVVRGHAEDRTWDRPRSGGTGDVHCYAFGRITLFSDL